MTLGLNNERMAAFNQGLLLFNLFILRESSLSELAKRMGLSIVAVSRIAKELIAKGLIVLIEEDDEERIAKGKGKGSGRKAGIIRFNHAQAYVVCIDVRPGSMHSVLSDLYGTVLKEERVSTLNMSTKESLIEDLEHEVRYYQKLLEELMKDDAQESKLLVALAFHGQVDHKNGVSILMPQASFHEPLYVKYLLEQSLGVEVQLDNDCVMRALAQKWYLLRQNPEVGDFCVINLDYGIGSSFLINHEIYRGPLFGSGQIGHTISDPNGQLCSCGRHGCLETIASTKAITASVEQALKAIDICPDNFSFKDVVTLYHSHDTLVRALVNRAAQTIGLAIYNFLNVLNINHIYLYGAACELGEEFLEVIRKQVLQNPFDSQQQVKDFATSIEFGTLSTSEQIAGIGYLYGERLTNLSRLSVASDANVANHD